MLRKEIWNHRYVYILLIPGLIYFFLFYYLPMYGILLAFKEFNFAKGITGSPWVGLDNFNAVWKYPEFWQAFRNTVIISVFRLVIEFPAPILLAVLINELARQRLRKWFQTIFTFPHFLSWVVLSGILMNLFSDTGVLNHVLVYFGMEKQSMLTDPATFRPFLYLTNLWKEIGWGAIIYLATISSINPELYEAARVDGANRFQQAVNVTWPGIRLTAAILFILTVGNTMNGGFDQIFNLYSPPVFEVGDILDTYIYRFTFVMGDSYSVSTAVGLLKSIINFGLLFGANFIVKRLGEEGMV